MLKALSLSLLLLGSPGSPSGTPESAKEENLYSQALFASIHEMEKAWGQIDDNNGGSNTRTDYRHMLVQKDLEVTADLPEQFGDHHVEYLDMQETIARYKKLGRDFSILKIHPMKNEGPSLKIVVSVYWVSFHHGKLGFALSDWSEVEFRFDPDRQNFTLFAIKLGGI
jgi:hypothetical protein